MRTEKLKNKIIKALLLLSLSLALLAATFGPVPRSSQAGPPRRSVRVLFVGNSYTAYNDLPWVTKQLALSIPGAKPLEVASVALMGATLKEHWEDGFALKRIREEGPWDYVILQGQSQRPLADPEEMKEYARLFDREIKAAGARTVLLVTWARREHPEQQAAITDVYAGLARELGARLAPVGPAWQAALAASPGLTLHRDDADNHPTAAGTYLSACVIYATLYGKSPEGATGEITDEGMGRHRFDLSGPALREIKGEPFKLAGDEALLLQRTAWDEVRRAGGW